MTLRLREGLVVLGALASVSAVIRWLSDSSCSLIGAVSKSTVIYVGLITLFVLTLRYEDLEVSARPTATFGVGAGLVIPGGFLWLGSDVGEVLGCPW